MKNCQLHLQTGEALRFTLLVKHFCLAFTMKHHTSKRLIDYTDLFPLINT